MNTRKALAGLRRFVKRLVADGVFDKAGFRDWKKVPKNEAYMERCLGYTRRDGMPSVTGLIQPFFHEELPLIGLNYSQVAHNTLHHFADEGWTPAIRLCRGIIFDHSGKLVAMPFPKFFNHGEHPETRNLPNLPFVATVKQDGHLGIIFEYGGDLHITTRGSFVSKTSVFSADMLAPYKERWLKVMSHCVNPLVEIIHPETEVLTDYKGWTGFILIGAFNRRTLEDFEYSKLTKLAGKLEIKVTDRWEGKSIADLARLMKDLSVENEEGFVAAFKLPDGGTLRVKFKYASYIGRMINEKLNLRYVMRRMMEGALDKRIGDLPGEVQLEAQRLRDQLLGVKNVTGSRKDRWAYLYELEQDEEERTDTYKTLCRSFQAWLVRTGELEPVK